MTHKDIAKICLRKLRKWKPYIHAEAKTGSVYIKFPHWKLGSIRIADHKGIKLYKYRWNICTHLKANHFSEDYDRGTIRIYVGIANLTRLFSLFEESAKQRNIKPGDEESYEERIKIENT